MNDLIREIENADSIAITGHINPDGDCIGSTLGMYNYITSNYPDKRVQVYLQEFPDVFIISCSDSGNFFISTLRFSLL